MIPHPSDTCSFLCLSYKHVVVSWILWSPRNVPDVVVKKLNGMAHDGIMPFALKGWEVGSVFPSLSSVFEFFGRSGFLVVCMGDSFIDYGLHSVLLRKNRLV